MKTIVLDTESNGVRPEQICQLAYIVACDGEVQGRNFFFCVTSMNEYAQRKHGLSKLRLFELSGGRDFSDRFCEFSDDFSGVDLICGHNIASDTRLLRMAFSDAGGVYLKPREFCTMAHFDNALHLKNKHGRHKPPRLDELCFYYGLSEKRIQSLCVELFGKRAYRAHDARFDAAATYLCILEGQARGDVKGVI